MEIIIILLLTVLKDTLGTHTHHRPTIQMVNGAEDKHTSKQAFQAAASKTANAPRVRGSRLVCSH